MTNAMINFSLSKCAPPLAQHRPLSTFLLCLAIIAVVANPWSSPRHTAHFIFNQTHQTQSAAVLCLARPFALVNEFFGVDVNGIEWQDNRK